MTSESETQLDRLVATYIRIRDERDRKRTEYETTDKALADQLGVIEAAMLEHCNSMGAETVRTVNGTIIKSVKSRYWTNDWESMYNFIRENNAFPLLEKRLHQTHMKEFLEQNPDVQPAGLNVERQYTVVVRRPRAGS